LFVFNIFVPFLFFSLLISHPTQPFGPTMTSSNFFFIFIFVLTRTRIFEKKTTSKILPHDALRSAGLHVVAGSLWALSSGDVLLPVSSEVPSRGDPIHQESLTAERYRMGFTAAIPEYDGPTTPTAPNQARHSDYSTASMLPDQTA